MKEKTMNYWLHRVAGHEPKHSLTLLNNGYISIGWRECAKEEIYNMKKDDTSEGIGGYIKSLYGKTRSRFNLINFFNMEKGDVVIVPNGGKISIYEILDEKPLIATDIFGYIRDDENIDFGFLRKVKLIPDAGDIERDLYLSSRLVSILKYRGTNLKLNDYQVDIEAAIKAKGANTPINLSANILNEISNSTLQRIKSDLNPDKFEKLIKWYFKRVGADETIIPAKYQTDKIGDGDMIATFEAIKTIIYVQAKFHDGETSDLAVGQIIDYAKFKEDDDDNYSKQLWVVSTCNSFSQKAIDEARENNVRLFNGLEFVNLIHLAGLDKLNSAF